VHFCAIYDLENLQRYCWGCSMSRPIQLRLSLLKTAWRSGCPRPGAPNSDRANVDDSHAKDFREWP
jgi:hypothetical protein